MPGLQLISGSPGVDHPPGVSKAKVCVMETAGDSKPAEEDV